MKTLCLLFLFLTAALRTQLDSLIEAERAFARMSVAKGMKEAFLANLAEDSIIFRPTAVSGKKWTQDNPAPSSQLSWEPEFADISSMGDLGYTTGPFEVRRTPQEPPVSFGHYVTVWRKQADGNWKVAIDIGIGHSSVPKPTRVDSPRIAGPLKTARSQREVESARKTLMDAERVFSYTSSLAREVRIYRQGLVPFGSISVDRNETYSWTPAKAEVSNSTDLGYTYGTVDFKTTDKPAVRNNYLRIWKKQSDEKWKVVLDLAS